MNKDQYYKYFVEYRTENSDKKTELFPTLEMALEFFKKAECEGNYVALYNFK